MLGRARGAALVAVVAIAGAIAACGDGGDDGALGASAPSAKPPPPLPAMPPPTRVVAPRWSEERSGIGLYPDARGVLTKPNGTEIRAWGDPRVRRYVAVLFARIQYDFLTGDMAAACGHIDPMSEFIPTGASPEAPCERKLRVYARELKDQGFRSPPLRFLWARTYPGITGLWVEDSSGRRFRVSFVQRGNGGWLLELGRLLPHEALAMPMRLNARG